MADRPGRHPSIIQSFVNIFAALRLRDEGDGDMARRQHAQPVKVLDDVIYEIIRQGPWVRITAMHEPTLTEIVVRGPANAGHEALQKLAHDRLAWVLGRRRRAPP